MSAPFYFPTSIVKGGKKTCVCMFVCVEPSAGERMKQSKEAVRNSRTGVTDGCELPIVVLQVEFWSPERALHAPTHWAISPSPESTFLKGTTHIELVTSPFMLYCILTKLVKVWAKSVSTLVLKATTLKYILRHTFQFIIVTERKKLKRIHWDFRIN